MLSQTVRSLPHLCLAGLLLLLLAGAGRASVRASDDYVGELDYLTFAQGTRVVRVNAAPDIRATVEHAMQAIDGNTGGFTYTSLISPDQVVEFVYELPAPTTFKRFAIPNVLETPSPAQTFVKSVSVWGSTVSADEGFVPLASAELVTHGQRGETTELTMQNTRAVRWVKLRLQYGIDVRSERAFLEFSEIIGNGVQETVPLLATFGGDWRGRGVSMALQQLGPVVSGCYDDSGNLTGTVTGNILRATGVGRDGVDSTFILTVSAGDALQGVRSSNGAPFRALTAARLSAGNTSQCRVAEPPALGCGSIVHGVEFDHDSAAVRPESSAVLDALYAGLVGGGAAKQAVVIEGHTSSEGSDVYNQRLSERRAYAVLDELQKRGLPAESLSASGAGEARPIAGNDDESGRSLNRRVEIHCR